MFLRRVFICGKNNHFNCLPRMCSSCLCDLSFHQYTAQLVLIYFRYLEFYIFADASDMLTDFVLVQ